MRPVLTASDVESALHVANILDCHDIARKCNDWFESSTTLITPWEKVRAGRRFSTQKWVVDGYRAMICAKELPPATLAAEVGLGLYWDLSSFRQKWIQKVSFADRQKEGEEFLSVLTADQKSEMTVDIERAVRDQSTKESFDVSEHLRSSVCVRFMLPRASDGLLTFGY